MSQVVPIMFEISQRRCMGVWKRLAFKRYWDRRACVFEEEPCINYKWTIEVAFVSRRHTVRRVLQVYKKKSWKMRT